MCNISGFEFIRIENLGDYFVRRCLKVQPTNGLARNVNFLVNRARDYVSKEAPQELFRNLLHSMSPKQAVETKRIFDLFLSERLNVVNEQAPGFAAARAPGGLVDSAPPAPKRRRLDENDQEERKKLATLETTEEKLQLMLELSKSTSRMKLSSGAKTFKTNETQFGSKNSQDQVLDACARVLQVALSVERQHFCDQVARLSAHYLSEDLLRWQRQTVRTQEKVVITKSSVSSVSSSAFYHSLCGCTTLSIVRLLLYIHHLLHSLI